MPWTNVGLLDHEIFQPLTPASSVTSDGSNPLSPITWKVRTAKEQAKRDKNTEASRKCRAKKKREFERIKQRVAELEEEKLELKRMLKMLTKRSGVY